MKTIDVTSQGYFSPGSTTLSIRPLLGRLLFIFLLYQSVPFWIYQVDPTAALPDAGIWSLVLLAILVFLMLLLLSSYLFRNTLQWLGLPNLNMMVSQFNTLTLWQQYVCYLASFALLLLAAIGCLIAIC
ncbi:MAG: hypothetical protein H7325_09340 [Pedobacter sp.]|nr:hypothetical protein [Pedobacter sp.]